MVVSSCKFLSNLFKSHPIVIRMGDITFLAIWDYGTSNVGIQVVNLTKARLKEFTITTGSDKGEHITLMSKKRRSHWYRACVGLSEVRRELLMETVVSAYKFRLRFNICCVVSEERRIPQIEDSSPLHRKSMCHISA